MRQKRHAQQRRHFPRQTFLYLEQVRHAAHLTQLQLAALSGVAPKIIGGIEAGRIRPRGDELQRLAAALRVAPPELLLRPLVPERSDLRTEETPAEMVVQHG